MSHSILDRVVRAAGWTLFGLAVAGPMIGLLVDVLRAGHAPRGGWWFSERQWVLLGKSAGLAAAAGVGSLLLAIPGAMVLAGRGGWTRPTLMTLLASPLLFPPTVMAFGWDRLTRADALVGDMLRVTGAEYFVQGALRAVWVWSCWLWPVGALLLSLGWRRTGRAAYELAILDGGRTTAIVRGVLPSMQMFLVSAWALIFAICMTDYQVPHACGQLVYATELISWVTETGHSIDVAWPSLPLVGLVALVVLAALRWGGREAGLGDGEPAGQPVGVGGAETVVMLAIVGVTIVLPVGALLCSTDLSAAMTRAWAVYGGELADSVGVAAVAALGSVVMADAITSGGAGGRMAAFVTLLAGVLPGALVGQSLVGTYISVHPVYDHWPVMALTFLARFGWVGVLAGWLGRRSLPGPVLEQARIDGADGAQIARWIRWPLVWPVLAAGWAIFLALAVAEVPAISLTRVPGIGNVALSLIENFHRFEDDMLVALSLWLCSAVLPAMVLVMVALHRRKAAIE